MVRCLQHGETRYQVIFRMSLTFNNLSSCNSDVMITRQTDDMPGWPHSPLVNMTSPHDAHFLIVKECMAADMANLISDILSCNIVRHCRRLWMRMNQRSLNWLMDTHGHLTGNNVELQVLSARKTIRCNHVEEWRVNGKGTRSGHGRKIELT